ncbi:helix-turn-helix domain-containing protein [Actinophytocola xanthii]|uniref:helix-turn-helix domain-containing protein n=1 Tax=Actinophytocola xanthii TaxID=1912961 RepID=UPI002FCE11B2
MDTTRIAPLWTVQDVSEFLGVPVNTLYQWRHRGYGPTARRVGRYIRYKQADVIAWVESLHSESA